MRTTATIIGGLGAGLGAFKGIGFVAITLILGIVGPCGFGPFFLLSIGTEGGTAVSCIAGLVGVGLAITGRTRTGAWLMLTAAAGVAAYAVAQGILLPSTQPPDVRAVAPSAFAEPGFYLLWLFPVLPLLVGAALAFLARDQSGSRRG